MLGSDRVGAPKTDAGLRAEIANDYMKRRKALREPDRGWVQWPDCVELGAARADVVAALEAAAVLSGRDRTPLSPMEVWLRAAFSYYDMDDVVCQSPIGRYTVDFLFTACRLVVEVDGREWHQDRKRDRVRDDYMRGLGYGVKRFVASEVNRDPLWCARQTRWALDDRRVA